MRLVGKLQDKKRGTRKSIFERLGEMHGTKHTNGRHF